MKLSPIVLSLIASFFHIPSYAATPEELSKVNQLLIEKKPQEALTFLEALYQS